MATYIAIRFKIFVSTIIIFILCDSQKNMHISVMEMSCRKCIWIGHIVNGIWNRKTCTLKEHFLSFCELPDFKSEPLENTYCVSSWKSWHIFVHFLVIVTDSQRVIWVILYENKEDIAFLIVLKSRKFSQIT